MSFWIWETWHTQQGKTLPKVLDQDFSCWSDFIAYHQLVTHLKGHSSPTALPDHSQYYYGRASPLRGTVARMAAPRWVRSDPTLWELLTGELQDLLDITGLRGGLPRTNISLFKSPWKSHKKLVSSHLHYPVSGGVFSVLVFSCTPSMPKSWITAEQEGLRVCRQLFRGLHTVSTLQDQLLHWHGAHGTAEKELEREKLA